MPSVQFAHHDGYTVIHMDEGLALFVTPDQLEHLADRFNDAVRTLEVRKGKEVDHATL
jgi:hypothetical protein